MFNNINRFEIKTLMSQTNGVCISIYMPTHPAQLKRQQEDAIRLRNLLNEAESTVKTVAPELRPHAIAELLEPAARFLREESPIWQQEGMGMAIFLAPQFARMYRLPLAFAEQLVVGSRFHVTPLLPLLSENTPFYVLALSQSAVRLLQGDRYGLREMKLAHAPKSLAETLQWDEFERSLQWHGGDGAATDGGRVAIFHGHGVGSEEMHKENLQRFLTEVAKGVQTELADEQVPLILAGVDYVVAMYRQVNHCPHLLDEWISGNPDELSSSALHEKAWALIQSRLDGTRAAAIDRYYALGNTPRVSTYLREILTAAHQGRLDTLFLTVDQPHWGYHDAETGYIHLYDTAEPGSVDLFNLAATYTLMNNGTIYTGSPEEIPGETGIAAIFRY